MRTRFDELSIAISLEACHHELQREYGTIGRGNLLLAWAYAMFHHPQVIIRMRRHDPFCQRLYEIFTHWRTAAHHQRNRGGSMSRDDPGKMAMCCVNCGHATGAN